MCNSLYDGTGISHCCVAISKEMNPSSMYLDGCKYF